MTDLTTEANRLLAAMDRPGAWVSLQETADCIRKLLAENEALLQTLRNTQELRTQEGAEREALRKDAEHKPTIQEVAQTIGDAIQAWRCNPMRLPVRTPHEVREVLKRAYPQWAAASEVKK